MYIIIISEYWQHNQTYNTPLTTTHICHCSVAQTMFVIAMDHGVDRAGIQLLLCNNTVTKQPTTHAHRTCNTLATNLQHICNTLAINIVPQSAHHDKHTHTHTNTQHTNTTYTNNIEHNINNDSLVDVVVVHTLMVLLFYTTHIRKHSWLNCVYVLMHI